MIDTNFNVSTQLATSLQVAQRRHGISDNPIGLSESLTRKPQEVPDIDFDSEIDRW
jgi:hypothetical protein